MFTLFEQMESYDDTVTIYVPHVFLPYRHTMAVALTNFDKHATTFILLFVIK